MLRSEEEGGTLRCLYLFLLLVPDLGTLRVYNLQGVQVSLGWDGLGRFKRGNVQSLFYHLRVVGLSWYDRKAETGRNSLLIPLITTSKSIHIWGLHNIACLDEAEAAFANG